MFVRKRKLAGKERYYIEHSIRLPNGKVKKFSKLASDYSKDKETELFKKYRTYFDEKEREAYINYALKSYKADSIFTPERIKKIESTRSDYKNILRKLTPAQMKDVFDRFVVNFTYESNALEGNSLTLKDVTMVLHENVAIKDKDLRDIYETKNSRVAMDAILAKKFSITKKDIIELHKIIVKDTGVAIGFKKLPNFLLMRNVKTTPPEKVADEIDELIDWYNSSAGLHPLLRATIFHARFEKIHPFEDGNGRVGRFLINIILLSNGYAPLIIRKTGRARYFNALEAFDAGKDSLLKWFMIKKYKDTFDKFFRVYIKYL